MAETSRRVAVAADDLEKILVEFAGLAAATGDPTQGCDYRNRMLAALTDGTRASNSLVPTVHVTRFDVTCIPRDHFESTTFAITVEDRGHGKWSAKRGPWALDASGRLSQEPIPSERTGKWLAKHRFDLEQALALAREHAPRIVINGYTVSQVLAGIEADRG